MFPKKNSKKEGAPILHKEEEEEVSRITVGVIFGIDPKKTNLIFFHPFTQ